MTFGESQRDMAIRELFLKLTTYWAAKDSTEGSALPVRTIAQGAALLEADFDYLAVHAPETVVTLPDTERVIDFSLLSSIKVHQQGAIRPGDIPILCAWHTVLLRSTFWTEYHQNWDHIGSLFSATRHADELWGMLDPLNSSGQVLHRVHSETLRDAVVYRQILANSSELSDRHPLDALARVCMPGYAERVQQYIADHRSAIDAMMGLRV